MKKTKEKPITKNGTQTSVKVSSSFFIGLFVFSKCLSTKNNRVTRQVKDPFKRKV